MKFKCVKSQLDKVIKEAENFTGKNLDLPVLSGIYLKAENGFLTIGSTDIDSAFKSEIPILLEEEGKVVVLGDVLVKVLSSIKGDDLEIILKDNTLNIISNNNNIEINTLNNEDFPDIISLENQNKKDLEFTFSISKNDLLDGFNSTIFSVSKSNIKPELSSVYIYGEKNNIFFVATDSFRLSEKQFMYSSTNFDFSFLIPSSSVNQIIKVLNISESTLIDIFVYKNQVFLKGEEFAIYSRLTDGDYVDYKKIIPEDTETSVILLKQDFIDATKLINIFSDDFNQIIFKISKQKFEMENKNTSGKNKIILDAAISGSELEMKFNHKFIQEAFSSINTDSVEFIFNQGRPMLIKPIGDNSFKYIIMPLSK